MQFGFFYIVIPSAILPHFGIIFFTHALRAHLDDLLSEESLLSRCQSWFPYDKKMTFIDLQVLLALLSIGIHLSFFNWCFIPTDIMDVVERNVIFARLIAQYEWKAGDLCSNVILMNKHILYDIKTSINNLKASMIYSLLWVMYKRTGILSWNVYIFREDNRLNFFAIQSPNNKHD